MLTNGSLQAWLEEALERHKVAGTSIAIWNDGRLLTAAAGVINVNTGVALTPDTVMHIGSITKVFNATLLMQLADGGLVDLDEPILRYLPDLRLRDTAALQRITVRMLLNHTSGIDGEGLADHGHDEETIEKAIARMAHLDQLFPPGTEFSYCNAGTVIAGYMAQRLTGKDWYSLLRERILEPLQLRHAVTLPEEALLHRASVGHYLNAKGQLQRTSRAFLPMSFGPAGVTTMISARDLVAFARTHVLEGIGVNAVRILSSQSARAMRKVTVNNHGKGYVRVNMGLGWMIHEDGLLQHGGGAPGVHSELYAHPEREFAAAVLTNSAHSLRLIEELMAPWLERIGSKVPLGMQPVDLPQRPVAIDHARYTGVYEDSAVRYWVSTTSEGLVLTQQAKFAPYETVSLEPSSPARLIPLGEDRFLMQSASQQIIPDSYRVLAFRNPESSGHMRYLGYGSRLRLRST